MKCTFLLKSEDVAVEIMLFSNQNGDESIVLVNIEDIVAELLEGKVIMKDDSKVPVSRTYAKE